MTLDATFIMTLRTLQFEKAHGNRQATIQELHENESKFLSVHMHNTVFVSAFVSCSMFGS